MTLVTERDVARLLEGKITDPREARRILDEIDKDPALARVADLLSDFDDVEDEPRTADAMVFPDLSRSQLCRLQPGAGLLDLRHGRSGRTLVEYARAGERHTFQLSWTTEGNAVRFLADWPTGLRPVGLVLAQFDLAKGRVPYQKEIKLPPLPKPKIEGTLARVGDQVPRDAGAQTGHLRTAAAATGEARTEKATPDKAPDFWGERTKAGALFIRGRLAEGRDEETVVVLVTWTGTDQTPLSIRVPVTLQREDYGPLGVATVDNFPWPLDSSGDQVMLSIQPLGEEDLVSLSNEQVTGLLATEYEHFLAVPILPDGDGHMAAEFRYPSEKAALAEPKATWWLEMTEEGGAA